MGFQADPVASAASIAILAGIGAFLMKMLSLSRIREERDSAAESRRKAQVLLLTGQLDLESYERATAVAETLEQEYEAAKNVLSVGSAQVQIGDPTAAPLERARTKVHENSRASPSRSNVTEMADHATTKVQSTVAERPEVRPRAKEGRLVGRVAPTREPESESPRSLVGDIMFGMVMVPLLSLFMFSIQPDPVMEGRQYVDPNCDPCIQLQREKAKSDGVAQSITEQVK